MKLDNKFKFLLVVLVIGMLTSLSANAYLLSEVTNIRDILDSQFSVITNLMKMLGFEFEEPTSI
jgi:hypothetical protein|tara:strand:+ start:9278 stop:9469 length:192 start_codon:yes stop_codon:yes gene_type:complete